jgi:hypothetical protein
MNEDTPDTPAPNDAFYTDAKGRVRWQENDRLAEQLKRLHDLLVIGGYDAEHAARYNRLAYLVSRHPEPISRLHAQDRLTTLPGVGAAVALILGELIETERAPRSARPARATSHRPRPCSNSPPFPVWAQKPRERCSATTALTVWPRCAPP